jgi:perosamine synthetase
MKIPLIKPYIDDDVKKRVIEVLESGYLTEGPVTKEFENKFSEYIGCKNSIAVTSCTTGLEIALRAIGIKEGDEVIVPDYTYPATASVVGIVGAKAVITDVDKDSMLIHYDQLEAAITEHTKAIIPVSGFGNPLDYDRLNEIKNKHGIFIIEDAACSVGAEYKNLKVGTFADLTVFSFHPRKFITTGEGGMVTTDNQQWADWMNSYKHFGMQINSTVRGEIQFDMIGTNYKLSNILSAVGLSQLNKIDVLLAKRRELAKNYDDMILDTDVISKPKTTEFGNHSYQSYCVFIKHRDKVMKLMIEEGIEVQIGTYSLHKHKAFSSGKYVENKNDYPNSIHAFNHCLTLPLYHNLSYAEQKIIINKLEESILRCAE